MKLNIIHPLKISDINKDTISYLFKVLKRCFEKYDLISFIIRCILWNEKVLN